MTLKVQDWLWKYYTKENSDSSIKCNYCEKIFSTCQKQSLKYHLGNHEITELDEHPERDSILNYYKKSKLTAECNLCKKIFDLSIHDVRSLKKHIANHPSLKCEYFVKDNIAMCIKCNLQKHLVHPSFRCEYIVKDNIAMCIKCNKILRLTSNSSENLQTELQTECRCRYYSKSDSDPESNDNLHKTLIESTKETKTNDTKKRKTDNVDIKKKTDNVDTKKRKTDNADTKKRKTDNADTTKRKTDNADTTKRKTDNADTKKRKTNNADTKKRKTDITDTKKRKTDIVDKCHTSLESNEDLPETIVISEAKETILDLTKKETGVINKNASNTSTKKEDFHDTIKSQLKIQIKEKVQLKKVILIIGRKSGP